MNELLQTIWSHMDMETAIKFSIAAVIGIIIGMERQLKEKPAGIKTTIVLSVGSCMLTIVSIQSAALYSVAYVMPMDPLRLAAQIVSGIGFLGGGVILHKQNDVISGLTTAAIIWASGGIGIAVGAGFYFEAILAMLMIIVSVEVLPYVFKKIGPKKLRKQSYNARMQIKKEYPLATVLQGIKSKDIKIEKVRIKETDTHIMMKCEVYVLEELYITDLFYNIKSIEGVIQLEIENI